MISQTYLGGFQSGREMTRETLARHGEVVDVGEWQSIKREQQDLPQQRTIELQNVVISYPIPSSQEALAEDVQPNLPFAEAQFQDRVSGNPLNPPPSDKLWPWAHHLDDDKAGGQYSHTYPERFWPKWAGPNYAEMEESKSVSWEPLSGVRYQYGDAADVVSLLQRSPASRQAFLPIWFPEDTGALQQQRVPCSLGYHFLRRRDRLNVSYFIRSVDFYRHFPDDVYMTCRLDQWVAEQLDCEPGTLTMHMVSLHVFEAERKRLEKGIR